MKFHKMQWLLASTVLSIILSSCNIGATPIPTQDVGAIQTQAFNAVLTQVAAAATPTPIPTNTLPPSTPTLAAPPTFIVVGSNTPFAFNTPLPGLTPVVPGVPTVPGSVPTISTTNGCNRSEFVGESAPYDGQIIEPSRLFQKNFDLINMGTCTWDEGYTFMYLPEMSVNCEDAYDIKIVKPEDFTAPGKIRTFSLKMRASVKAGEHLCAWKMKADNGQFFGTMVHLQYFIGTKASRDATAEADSLTATAEAKGK